MKRFTYLLSLTLLVASLASCGSVQKLPSKENDLAGYTLKNKKEQMQHKILNKKFKTVIATP